MPQISVIIPVYNGEETIQETIQSVLKQTFSNFELIIINDGSQDTTLKIVQGIVDPRIQIFSYSNAGQAISRNRGLSHSIGKLIAFLDADDLWTSDKLETQFQALQNNVQAAVAYSWTNSINELGHFLRQGCHVNLSGDVYQHLLVTNFLENGSNPLIRRQALIEVGGFDGLFTPAEDWDMWLRLAARYHFVAVPIPQVLYRVSANSSSTNVYKLEAGALQVINRAFTNAPDSLKYLKKYSKVNLYKYLIFKSLEGVFNRNRNLKAAKFLWHTVNYEPSFLARRVTWKILLRIAITFFLPPQFALLFLSKRRQLYNIEDLFLSK